MQQEGFERCAQFAAADVTGADRLGESGAGVVALQLLDGGDRALANRPLGRLVGVKYELLPLMINMKEFNNYFKSFKLVVTQQH